MKRCIPLLLFVFLLTHTSAQNKTLGSIHHILQGTTEDTARVFTLLRIGVEHIYSQPDSAMTYANKAYELSKKEEFTLVESQSLAIIGNLLLTRGDYINALEMQFKVLGIQEKRKDTSGIAASYNNKALIYEEQEDYASAIWQFNVATF